MLVLARKQDQEIRIGPIPAEAVGTTITVVLCRLSPPVARIGIEADESIPIVREEIAKTHRGAGPSGEAIERRRRRGGEGR
jgi:sRNA-binding carbon storage regulator CsrA